MTVSDFAFPGVRHVAIRNFGGGSITVESSSQPDIVEGSLAADPELLDLTRVRHENGTLRIDIPQRAFRPGDAHLRLGVPPGLTFAIGAASADVLLTVDIGRSKIASGSGDISLAGAADLVCTSGSGDLMIDALTGAEAQVSTGSGNIEIRKASCPVSAKSGSGNVLLRALHSAELRASSGSGDIAIPSTSGSVDLRSASGSLTVGVADELPAWLNLDSVSGSIRIALAASNQPADGDPYVSVRARTASGEITVYRA